MARRSARLVALVLSVVGISFSACASLDEVFELEERIERQGYRDVSAFHEDFGTGRNEVQVDAASGRGERPPLGQLEIAEIVWETYPRRFESLVVTLDDDQRPFTRGQLQERFGARLARLDEREFSEDVNSTLRTVAFGVVGGIVIAVVLTVVIVVQVRRRKRARLAAMPPPTGRPNPPPGPTWGAPPPPPHGPPPGWRPPPSSGPPPTGPPPSYPPPNGPPGGGPRAS